MHRLPARRSVAFLLSLLVVVSGCVFAPATDPATRSADPSPTATARDSTFYPTPTASPTLTSFPDIPDGEAGRRAIAAEKARIEHATNDWENLTDLRFGILRPATYDVVDRNETGVLVDVEVGYSMEFACGNATESTHSVDGAGVEARYLVTDESVELLSGDDIYDTDAHVCE